ncbi:MAG: glycosyltransferase family 39 protein [Acidobacteria bacterium]|nr:glycosyltransferase family 39 protein [Acidobacteriota bacterium]
MARSTGSISGRTIVLGLAAVKLIVHLVYNRGYGYFRDELYFFTCGDRLDWGYADHPPLVALASAAGRGLFGDTLSGVRFLPAIAGALLVVVTGAIAREMGGRRFAQALAAVSVIAAPILLAQTNFLSMNAFEPLLWMTFALVVVRIIRGADPRWWLAAGLVAGIGMQNKYSMAFFGASLVGGILLTPERRILANRWAWAGAAAALAVWLPNVLWNFAYGWPILEILRNAGAGKNFEMSPLEFFTRQIVLAGPATFPIWVAGICYVVASRRVRQFRALGIAYVLLFALLVALRGKDYYIAPIYPMLFAAGAIAVERAAESPRLRLLEPLSIGAVAACGVILAPLVLPVLSVDGFVEYSRALGLGHAKTENHEMGRLPQFQADMFGWEEMARAVAEAYGTLSDDEKARVAIFAQNYGEAGAIDFFGPKYGLPKAISGHQNYWLWGPRGYTGEIMITIGIDREDLEKYFATVEEKARVQCGDCMPYENDNPVYVCRGIAAPLQEVWPVTKHWR